MTMPGHARLPLWRDRSPEAKLDRLHDLVLDLYRYQLGEALAQIVANMDAHQPADDKEARDIQRMKELIAEHPNILNMNCEIGHITASALIVHEASRRTLLHFHKRLNRWLQVGGHTDYDRDPAQAALREAREETGLPDLTHYPARDPIVPIDYDIHPIPEYGELPRHLHLDFRYILVTSQPDALAPAAGESTRFRWLGFEEAYEMGAAVDASLLRLLRKANLLFADAAGAK
ncbi:MAG: NUDIX hydrolase [Chloroflexi bacterium]|nr:NUDIX hydrolase [Chloroflexota bacterium]